MTVLAEITVSGALDDAAGAGDRAPDRDLAARQDGALRPRRQLGPRADGGREARPGTAATPRSTPSGCGCATTAPSSSTGAPRSTSSRTSRGRAARSSSISGSAAARAGYLTTDLSYDYVPHQRGLPDVSRLVDQGRRRRRRRVRGRRARDLARRGTRRSASSTAPGPQISQAMERAGIPVEFIQGRRVTSEAGIVLVARGAARRQRRDLRGDRRTRGRGCYGDEIGLEATAVPELGLVGDPLPCAPAAIVAALEPGSSRSSRRSGVGPLNVNADAAAAALAVGLRRRAAHLPHRRRRVAPRRRGRRRDRRRRGGTACSPAAALQGGIIPKLGAAVTAARGGVPAWIGRTAVAA